MNEEVIKQTKPILKEITDRFSVLEIYEKRVENDRYSEIVFHNKDLREWEKIFLFFLGLPAKPPKTAPRKEHLLLTKDYGGIYNDQTLFKKEFEGFIILAMFWPWQDRLHTTLKVILLEKAS